MPQLLPNGLPERARRSGFDFSEWADGQAWKFLRGEDYTSTTDSFRYSVKRWAATHGYKAETRPLPATDERGRPLAASQAEPIGLAVRFVPSGARADGGSETAARSARSETDPGRSGAAARAATERAA